MSQAAIPEQLGQATSLVDYEFQNLTTHYVQPLPDGKGFETSRLRARLGSLPYHTFMAVPDYFSGVNTEDNTLTVNGYVVPAFALGRQESQRDVSFGELVLGSKAQTSYAELVAMKPATAAAAAHEFHASDTVARRLQEKYERRLTFENVGFFFEELAHKVNLVTKYEYGVQSMDRVMWSRDNMPAQDQVIDVMGKAAETLAMLHGEAGVAHGDPQPKNIASDTKGIRIIDLEEAQDMLDKNGEVNPLKARRYMTTDLENFLLVLGGDYTDLVKEHFAQPYAERMAESDLLLGYVQLSVPEILDISRQDQRPVPYLGPRF